MDIHISFHEDYLQDDKKDTVIQKLINFLKVEQTAEQVINYRKEFHENNQDIIGFGGFKIDRKIDIKNEIKSIDHEIMKKIHEYVKTNELENELFHKFDDYYRDLIKKV